MSHSYCSHSTEFEAFLRGFQRKNPSFTAFRRQQSSALL